MLKPIKPRLLAQTPLPKGVIYKKLKDDYSLLETATGKCVGVMNAGVTTFDPNSLYKKKRLEDGIFHIYSLEIKKEEQYKGWGEYFIDFAKAEGYKEGCEGRMSLVAYNKDYSPHIFYWKQGFRSTDAKVNRIIRNCIKKRQNPFFLEATPMYMPIKEVSKPKEAREIILKKIKRFLGFQK